MLILELILMITKYLRRLLMILAWKKKLFFRDKIIILSSPNSKASRVRTEDLWSFGGNLNIFGCVFWKKIMFIKLSQPHESTHVKRSWMACWFFGWHTQLSRPYESILWVDLCCCVCQNYRTVIFCSVPQKSTPWVDSYVWVDLMSRPLQWKNSITTSF